MDLFSSSGQVTVIEFMDRICATMDKELTDAFHKSLKKNLGFEFKLKTKARPLPPFPIFGGFVCSSSSSRPRPAPSLPPLSLVDRYV